MREGVLPRHSTGLSHHPSSSGTGARSHRMQVWPVVSTAAVQPALDHLSGSLLHLWQCLALLFRLPPGNDPVQLIRCLGCQGDFAETHGAGKPRWLPGGEFRANGLFEVVEFIGALNAGIFSLQTVDGGKNAVGLCPSLWTVVLRSTGERSPFGTMRSRRGDAQHCRACCASSRRDSARLDVTPWKDTAAHQQSPGSLRARPRQ